MVSWAAGVVLAAAGMWPYCITGLGVVQYQGAELYTLCKHCKHCTHSIYCTQCTDCTHGFGKKTQAKPFLVFYEENLDLGVNSWLSCALANVHFRLL